MEEFKVELIKAEQAKAAMPQSKPIDRTLYRKVMNYSFELIKQRSSAGFGYVNMSLTKMPELEIKRIKLLKRLHYEVKELEFALEVSWSRE